MLHRTLCDCLEELRTCHETRNYSYYLALVEEAQSMANRMEAGLARKQSKINNLEEQVEEIKENLK